MSMSIIEILVFAAGALLGAGMLELHHWSVAREVRAVQQHKNRQIAKLRSECSRLHEESGIMQQASDCADAFRRGKNAGRSDPMTSAERFARTFEGRNVTFIDTTRRGDAK